MVAPGEAFIPREICSGRSNSGSPESPAGQAAELRGSPGEGGEMEAAWFPVRSSDILLAGGFIPGCVVSEKFGKEEREKRNAAVMAEEEVMFCGASALCGRLHVSVLWRTREQEGAKTRGILVLTSSPFLTSVFIFSQLSYFL